MAHSYQNAETTLDKSPAARKSASGHAIKADLHRVAGYEAAAGRAYVRVVKLARNSRMPGLRAYAQAQLADVACEISTADAALERNPRDVHAHHALALVGVRSGNRTEAEGRFKRIAEIAPPIALYLIDDPQFELIPGGKRMSKMVRRARIARDATLNEVWRRHPTLKDFAPEEMAAGQTVVRQGA